MSRRLNPSQRALRRLPVGLAVCSLCGDEALVRPRCWLCRGLGFVGRECRNAYKRGAAR